MGRRGLYPAIAGAVTAAAFALAGAAPSRHFAGQSLSAVPIDVELVIAVDVSYSMDPEEQALQREGYVMALTSREFLRALREGANGKIAVTYFEWAGQSDQKIIMPWRLIDGPVRDGLSNDASSSPIFSSSPSFALRYLSCASILLFVFEAAIELASTLLMTFPS